MYHHLRGAGRAATSAWLNAHMHGLAGHPITLDVCVDDLDPGKASDCANQMIRDDVDAVVIGSNGVIETSWKILHDAKIPVITNAVTSSALLTDTSSTFMINDPIAQVVNLPIAVAKDVGAKKISTIVVDLPIATDVYKNSKSLFDESGVTVDVVPVALGTADLTPQAQQIETNNPDGLVSIVGPDTFCIAALNSLRAVGYQGSRFMISQCLTDATRKAIPGSSLKGIVTASLAPIGDAGRPVHAAVQRGARHVCEEQGRPIRSHRSDGVPKPLGPQRGNAGFERRRHAARPSPRRSKE